MKDNFNEIYDVLYADYIYEEARDRSFYPERTEYNILRIIRRAIDRSNNNYILRSDAKYFLLVNFHHLVAKPLIENIFWRDAEAGISINNLETAIQSDIQLIIETSIKNATLTENIENSISGHMIIATVDSLWKDLSTMKFEIWG